MSLEYYHRRLSGMRFDLRSSINGASQVCKVWQQSFYGLDQKGTPAHEGSYLELVGCNSFAHGNDIWKPATLAWEHQPFSSSMPQQTFRIAQQPRLIYTYKPTLGQDWDSHQQLRGSRFPLGVAPAPHAGRHSPPNSGSAAPAALPHQHAHPAPLHRVSQAKEWFSWFNGKPLWLGHH